MSDTPRTDHEEIIDNGDTKPLLEAMRQLERELNERLTKQHADMLDTIIGLRSELTRWQALAEGLAEALNHCGHAAYCESVMWFPGKCTCGKADALAAYEAATAGGAARKAASPLDEPPGPA